MDPEIQRWKRTTSGSIVSRDADQRRGTPEACDYNQFPDTRRKCQPTDATRQTQQQGTPKHPLQPQLTQARIPRVWYQRQNSL